MNKNSFKKSQVEKTIVYGSKLRLSCCKKRADDVVWFISFLNHEHPAFQYFSSLSKYSERFIEIF